MTDPHLSNNSRLELMLQPVRGSRGKYRRKPTPKQIEQTSQALRRNGFKGILIIGKSDPLPRAVTFRFVSDPNATSPASNQDAAELANGEKVDD